MSNGRKKYTIADIDEINKAFGFPTRKKKSFKNYDEKKRKAQRIKFCRCSECGGMMVYISNTNTLLCENIVEKTKVIQNKEGDKLKVVVEERCGNINVVSPEYSGYLAYLFDGVPANQAVIDFQKKAEHKAKINPKKEDKESE